MKKVLMQFSEHVLTRSQMKAVKGGEEYGVGGCVVNTTTCNCLPSTTDTGKCNNCNGTCKCSVSGSSYTYEYTDTIHCRS